MRHLTTFLPLSLLLACGAGGSGDTGGMTYDAFVATYTYATCDWMVTCEPELVADYFDFTTAEECADHYREQWEADRFNWPATCYSYDEEAARDCLSVWEEAPPDDGECGDEWSQSRQVDACGYVCSNG